MPLCVYLPYSTSGIPHNGSPGQPSVQRNGFCTPEAVTFRIERRKNPDAYRSQETEDAEHLHWTLPGVKLRMTRLIQWLPLRLRRRLLAAESPPDTIRANSRNQRPAVVTRGVVEAARENLVMRQAQRHSADAARASLEAAVKVIRPNHVSDLSRKNVLQCRKTCTGQQKGLPFVPFPGPSEKALLFRFAEEAGTYVPLTTRSRKSDTADEL